MSDTIITKFSGKTDRIERDLTKGDRVIVIAEATTGKLEIDGGDITRNLKIVDIHELDGDLGRGLIAALRSARRAAEDAAAGRDVLPGLAVTTDVAGIVATAVEQAAMRGEAPPTPDASTPPPDGFGVDLGDPDDGEGIPSNFPGPIVDLGDFVDTLGKPLADVTATELKSGLERHLAKIGPAAMAAVAAAVARVEEGRKVPRKRVLDACTGYLTLPTPPPAAQAGEGDTPPDDEPDDALDLGDDATVGEGGIDAVPDAGDFVPGDDEPDEDDPLAGFDLEDEAP